MKCVLEGNYKSIQILKETNSLRGAVPHIRQSVMGNNDDCLGDDDSEVDTSEFQSNVEDGRIVVASRQSKGRRN
ncbi:unnamed protein product [Camellia sinensis]